MAPKRNRKLLLLLPLSPVLALGCWCCIPRCPPPDTLKNDFGPSEKQIAELCGRELSKDDMDFALIGFAPAIHRRYGIAPLLSPAYVSVTFLGTGKAVTGKYDVWVNPRETGYHEFAVTDGGELADCLVRPKAPPGVRPILPGEVVYQIPSSDAHFRDRYLVDLPGNQPVGIAARLHFGSTPLTVSALKGKEVFPTTFNKSHVSYHFTTREPGAYEIVVEGEATPLLTPRYHLYAWWGDLIVESTYDVAYCIQPPPGADESISTIFEDGEE